MILIVQLSGALFGLLAVILGAFGSHRLKKTFTGAQMGSFETGIKYQFYHALLLLVLGYNLGFNTSLDSNIAWCFIIGTLLFSFSIYLLCFLGARGIKVRLLGLLTPVGGLFLVAGWSLLLYSYVADLF